ncbi:uncharacterized protein EDB91DRAFT_1080989 [Suillus paluster]|uniref:uncharacterized protein n=1 Tax=Suillus paluster TaxID=48578 RepID=UPI001B87B8CC|nr:uncharacterized protein EDB91DRAFT_1080989 [Suillus paluster]KAG1743586.1 hypothetical protein EDB91DRAFT_1080989 [Suillus paluster]
MSYCTVDVSGAFILLRLSLPEQREILAAVGKFHLSAHKLPCFARFSLNFIKGAGQVDGEILETLWATFNKISPTARSMSQAHRQEILDDHMRDSNWKKMVGIVMLQTVKTLIKKHTRAVKGVRDTKLPFDELTHSLDCNKIMAWERDEKLAMEKRGEHLDIYQLKIDKGKSGTVSWIIQGINLEDAQAEGKLDKGSEVQCADEDDLGWVDDEIPAENMRLWMPSSVPPDQATFLGLAALQAEELELRKGQANNCLEKLCLALGHKAIIYCQHFQSADSVWTGTRSKQEAQCCRLKIEKYVRSYQRARSSMQRLGMDQDTLLDGAYQEILPEQLSVDKEVTEENRFGQGSDRLAWFWRVNNAQESQKDAWMDEFYRVNWLKAKARWQRWEEELCLVQHEMGWTLSWFKHEQEEWYQ